MDRVCYPAASGLGAHRAAQAAIANNIANASTTGFKADRVRFDQLYLIGQGLETLRPTSEEVIGADRNPGTVQQTGRPLDVAMAGDARLAVQATDGSEAYDRKSTRMNTRH